MNMKFNSLQRRLRDPAMTALLVLEVSIIFVMSPLRAMSMGPPPIVIAALVLLIIVVVVTLSRSPFAIVLIYEPAWGLTDGPGRKYFFFEKKKQKTFTLLVDAADANATY
jgi:hypothetical protein